MQPGGRAGSFVHVLKNRQFLILWLAQLVSNFGDWLAVLALFSLVAFRWHGTPYQVAGIIAAFFIPWTFLGPVAGVFVDRWNLKWTMVTSDLIRAVLILAVAFATRLDQVYALFFAVSAVSCFFLPAQNAAIPQLVKQEELLVANAVNAQAIQFNKMVSPAIAGFLVAWAGEKLCFYLDSVSFLMSAALLAKLALPARPAGAGKRLRSLLQDLREGLVFLWRQPALRFVTLAMATALFMVGAFDALIAVYVRDILRAQSQTFGALVAIIAVGAIVGAFLIGKFAQRQPRVLLVVAGILGLGAGVFLLAVARTTAQAVLWSMCLGLAASCIVVPSQTLVQELTPQTILGRVSSASISLMTVAQLVGVLVAGKAADWMGIRNLYLLLAALLAGTGFVGFTYARMNRLSEARAPTLEL